jgi:hypothetical protein
MLLSKTKPSVPLSPMTAAVTTSSKPEGTVPWRCLLLAQWLYVMLWQLHCNVLLFLRRLSLVTRWPSASSKSLEGKSLKDVGRGKYAEHILDLD